MRLFRSKKTRREELFSAGIDGRLTAKEQAGLERILQASAEAREEFESLRSAVALVRQVPKAAPRRSFALTPELVGTAARPSSRGPWTLMPLATALATAFLAFSIVGGMTGLFEDERAVSAPSASQVETDPKQSTTAQLFDAATGTPLPASKATPTAAPAPTAVSESVGLRLETPAISEAEVTATTAPLVAFAPSKGTASDAAGTRELDSVTLSVDADPAGAAPLARDTTTATPSALEPEGGVSSESANAGETGSGGLTTNQANPTATGSQGPAGAAGPAGASGASDPPKVVVAQEPRIAQEAAPPARAPAPIVTEIDEFPWLFLQIVAMVLTTLAATASLAYAWRWNRRG